MRAGRIFLVLVCLTALSYLAQAKQLAIVVDKGNSATNLTAAELAKIFTAHTRNWPDDKPVKVVMRDPTSADMQLVVRKLFNMTPGDVQAFVQTHRDHIVIADSDDAVLRFVSANRGAIGVIDLYSLTKDVTVLKIDGKLPVEQGYLLRGN